MKNKIELLIDTIIYVVFDRVLSLFVKVDDFSVAIISDIRGENGGNLKCVEEYMKGRGVTFRHNFKPGKNSGRSLGDIYDLAKTMRLSKYIVLEDYFHFTAYTRLKDGQEILQVWHGAGAFKKFAHSRLSSGDNIRIHKGYSRYTKAITSAEAITRCYAEAFNIDESKVRATGIPDTDVYFDKEELSLFKEKLTGEYPAIEGKKLILFAPTYRAASQRDASYSIDVLDLDALYKNLHEDYIFAFKWHPAMYENLKDDNNYYDMIGKYPDFFIDLSAHRDISEILPAVDVLITDYSSVIFDYYLLDRPIVFFPYDIESYEDARGLYYDYDEYTYGKVVYDCPELIEAIKSEEMCEDKRKDFGEKFMSACDGHSTEKTCKWFFNDVL